MPCAIHTRPDQVACHICVQRVSFALSKVNTPRTSGYWIVAQSKKAAAGKRHPHRLAKRIWPKVSQHTILYQCCLQPPLSRSGRPQYTEQSALGNGSRRAKPIQHDLQTLEQPTRTKARKKWTSRTATILRQRQAASSLCRHQGPPTRKEGAQTQAASPTCGEEGSQSHSSKSAADNLDILHQPTATARLANM